VGTIESDQMASAQTAYGKDMEATWVMRDTKIESDEYLEFNTNSAWKLTFQRWLLLQVMSVHLVDSCRERDRTGRRTVSIGKSRTRNKSELKICLKVCQQKEQRTSSKLLQKQVMCQ
jgi:hypothetical protein